MIQKWQNFFDGVEDFRKENFFKLYLLSDILMISLCGVIAGAETAEDIAEYGIEKESFLRTFLHLPNGIPSHDTFTRVFRYLDPEKFSSCLYKHSRELLDFINEYQINIDGKVCRGTNPSGKKKGGICIISAWASEQNLLLGQCKVDQKSNEKTAIPELLEELDIKNGLVTIDAIANSPSVAKQIIDKGGNYILSLKKNQRCTFEQVEDFMKRHLPIFECDKHIDFGSGRIEKRTCYVSQQTDLMTDVLSWEGIKSIIMIHSTREKGDKIEENYRFYLSSKKESAAYFNEKIRNHWSIENQLHWHLDISFQEDRCRTSKGNGTQNFSTLRKMALQSLKIQNDKHSISVRRKKAAWNDNYLVQVLQNLNF